MPLIVQIFGMDYSSSNYGFIFSIYTCFVVLNIVLLAQADNFSFATTTLIIGIVTYAGFINLIFLKKHMVEFKNSIM